MSILIKKAISPEGGPRAIGPYSMAVQCGEWVFCSGQIGIDPATGELVSGGIREQTAQCLKNLEAVLRSVGLNLSHVVKTTVFLTDMALFQDMNAVYAEFFTEPFPARSTVQVAGLPRGALIEIEAIARGAS